MHPHSTRVCSIDGCQRTAEKRGWCSMHYKRWRKHGDPNFVPPTAIERFWSRVKKLEGPDACWIWTGSLDQGYGVFRADGMDRAHRFIYQYTYEVRLETGQYVCHHCDNPPCVRPDHLFIGTAADNAADMLAKGRKQRGEQCYNAKLTKDGVIEIRLRREAGESATSLAIMFNVSRRSIRKVCNKDTWKDVS